MSESPSASRGASGRRATLLATALLLAVLGVAAAIWILRSSQTRGDEEGVRIKLRLAGAREEVRLVESPEGFVFVLDEDGAPRRLNPEEFAAALYDQERQRDWLAVLLNITSPIGVAWVALGLLGQILFAGRMIVQWLYSERHRRSIVPPVFWWLSLAGSMLLLAYFLWRTDIVGILGQSLGFVIYARNLMLIRRARQIDGASET